MNKAAFLILFSSLFLVACEQDEDDKIYTAQTCMDHADTGPEADACLAPIAGINTPRAYVLRCAGDFIRGGITTPTIISAIENIDNNDSTNTADPTLQFYQEFSFSADAATVTPTDITNAATAVTNCTASGSSNLRILALSAQNATLLRSLAPGGDLVSWLDGSGPDVDPTTLSDAEITSVGNNIIAMQSTACVEGGTFEGTEICDNINNAISAGGGNALTIGEAFINQLESSND